MSLLEQIKKSNLSKQGLTSETGIFEGTPQNVVIVQRDQSVPNASSVLKPIVNPIDVVYGAKPQPTYLDYLKSVNKK